MSEPSCPNLQCAQDGGSPSAPSVKQLEVKRDPQSPPQKLPTRRPSRRVPSSSPINAVKFLSFDTDDQNQLTGRHELKFPNVSYTVVMGCLALVPRMTTADTHSSSPFVLGAPRKYYFTAAPSEVTVFLVLLPTAVAKT